MEIGGSNLGRQPVGMVPLAAVAVSSLSNDCAPGWVDIGPTCVQDTDAAGRTYGDAISYCYAQSARVCDQQDHVVICKESAALGLSYANAQWYWTGDRHWERYDSGVTYPAHGVARRYGSGDNGCFDNYTGAGSNMKVSWDYGNKLYPVFCCRDQ